MGNDDYGYFGEGDTGYAHYTLAHDRAFSSNSPTSFDDDLANPLDLGDSFSPSSGKPTGSRMHTPPSPARNNTVNNGETMMFLMMFWGTIFSILDGILLLLLISDLIQGYLNFTEFLEFHGYVLVFFGASLACSIIGIRHFFR